MYELIEKNFFFHGNKFTAISAAFRRLELNSWNGYYEKQFWNLFLCLLQLKIQILEWTLGREIQHIPVNLDRVKFSVVSSIDSYMSA